MSGNWFWGGFSNRQYDDYRPSIRTRFVSSYELRRAEVSCDNSVAIEDKFGRRRSPSLPPIYKHNYQEETGYEGEEGETSGYASDSGERQEYQPTWNNSQKPSSRLPSGWHSSNCVNTPDSLNSEGGRPRWGDKGVGVGHLWDASLHNPDARLPSVTDRPGPTPPAWLCRATNNTVSEVLVITHPESSSPVTEIGSCDTISNSDRTYLRGQNISIEPEELLERERKRQKAKELQNAIRLQLEERDKKRKEERERRQKEERLEEERFRKQQEIERKRLEEEHQKQREKEIKEEQKEKAMKEALERAERLAKEEKIKTRKKHKLETDDAPLPVYQEKTIIPSVTGSELKIARVEVEPVTVDLQRQPTEQVNVIKKEEKESYNHTKEPEKEQKPIEEHTTRNVSQLPPSEAVPRTPVGKREEPPREAIESSDEPDSPDETQLRGPEVALVLSEPQEVQVNQLSLVVSPGRLLTPTKFRTNHHYEKGTQTQVTKSESKAALRSRSQQRLGERPKWGVNRPDTQYIKQSERDPYYQTRLRRNTRGRTKTTKTEREDSRSPSPINMKIQGSQAPVTTVTRGTITPRVMQMVLPTYSSIRPKYLSFKGGVAAVVASNSLRHRVDAPPHTDTQTHTNTDMALVQDVLDQLSSLRQGLTMKQKEWDISRSQTPFSEASNLSTSV
ncbi:trichohyalin isoform X2 [Macrosteles quadrilineatus]|nr:trichohyalin isoform X2 [Macrosteles quadrilineatus]